MCVNMCKVPSLTGPLRHYYYPLFDAKSGAYVLLAGVAMTGVSVIAQIPTEDFFTNQFGLPLTMNPNFEDLSCEMIFGQRAPPIEQDPLYNQPCFAHECTLAKREPVPCPKIDTDRHKKKLPVAG